MYTGCCLTPVIQIWFVTNYYMSQLLSVTQEIKFMCTNNIGGTQ